MFHVKQYDYDIIVVGGGHAGVEASLSTHRLGLDTLLITMSEDNIARMSCNPSIGGLAKGHLVAEIDALGGEMGKAIDKTGFQFKILNRSKGKAVQSPRAQADKVDYSNYMQNIIKAEGVDILEDIVIGVLTKNEKITGVKTTEHKKISSEAVILCCGTFLNGKITIGQTQYSGGRLNEEAAKGLTESLKDIGFDTGRLKTGTPARLRKDTINLSKLEEQHQDTNPEPFSFHTDRSSFSPPDIPCFVTRTNKNTHNIIKNNLNRAPLFNGTIEGTGPRYCPSLEDKVVQFSDKDSHHVFLEPEWKNSQQIYANGISTSVPIDVQREFIHTIRGLEKAEMIRPGYAIEYDFFPSYQLYRSLETKSIENLFFAGQINGTSGYEEAAALGLWAGINSAYKINQEEPFILDRSDAYIGVLIDDLITKDPREPYRMFTSRAEYRLLLRYDNADRRLLDYSHKIGLIDKNYYKTTLAKKNFIENVIEYTKNNYLSPKDINPILKDNNSSTVDTGININKVLKRPNINLNEILTLLPQKYKQKIKNNPEYGEQIQTDIKYEGYIKKNKKLIQKMKKHENINIPEEMDFSQIDTLKKECIEKLNKFKPETLAQASRISGITPSDITSLMIHLKD